MSDRPSGGDKISISVDFRSPPPENNPNAWTTKTPYVADVTLLLNVLTELAGPGADIIFDFGQFTIRDIDLDEFRQRFGATP